MLGFINLLPEYLTDALKDSLNLVPFLFLIFIFIEIFEHYFSNKINTIVKYSRGIGPIIGTLVAIIPQCGFSVIASTLYIKRFISIGTLLSVYIATSDEAIPILMAAPNQFVPMLKIILTKCIIAIPVGYIADFLILHKNTEQQKNINIPDKEKGCCGHIINETDKSRIFLHPIKHTCHIFGFIFLVCLILNYLFAKFGIENIQNHMLQNSILQPIIVGVLGLIPNCAVSIIITMMFINNVISFGSTIAGLSSSAGLGLLVLIRKNQNIKNTLLIILCLLSVSIISGILIQIVM